MSMRSFAAVPLAAAGLAVLLIAGCYHHAEASWFTRSSYRAISDRYGFRYRGGKYPELLPPAWRLDNFEDTGDGLRIKTRGAYLSTLSWEMSDGELRRADVVTHDLLFRHSNTNGTIWVRRLPLPRASRGKAVRVLAENYAGEISGSVYEAALDSRVTERRVSTKLLAGGPIEFGSHKGHAVTFDVADLNRLELDPQAPRTRVTVILIEGAFDKHMELIGGSLTGGGGATVPALLLLGYANDAGVFEAHLPDFNELLTRLWIR
jgi:hypothetical protein